MCVWCVCEGWGVCGKIDGESYKKLLAPDQPVPLGLQH